MVRWRAMLRYFIERIKQSSEKVWLWQQTVESSLVIALRETIVGLNSY